MTTPDPAHAKISGLTGKTGKTALTTTICPLLPYKKTGHSSTLKAMRPCSLPRIALPLESVQGPTLAVLAFNSFCSRLLTLHTAFGVTEAGESDRNSPEQINFEMHYISKLSFYRKCDFRQNPRRVAARYTLVQR